MNLFKPNEHSLKEVVINQHFELGDILYIEPIFRHYHNQGYRVIAPVRKEYIWVKDYIPYVEFFDKEKFSYGYEVVNQIDDGRLHIPMRFAHPLYRGYELHYGDDRKNWMGDKYLFLGLDPDMYRTLQFNRNMENEERLIKQLSLPEKFNLVNKYFGGSFEEVKIKTNNDLPNVYLQKTEGFTLIDWLSVIQLATNIYTVETSLIYLIESYPLKAEELHIYPRHPFLPNVDYIKSCLSKNWTCHDDTDL